MSNDDELAALKARVAQLELERASKAVSAEDNERSTAEWRDQVHKWREARANSWTLPPENLREMEKACSTSDIQDLVRHGRVQSPSGAGASGVVTGVRVGGGPSGVAGDGTGWAIERELGPPPGINYVDRLCDEQDRRDMAERIAQEARRKLMEGK
jgi:hypothetical protein